MNGSRKACSCPHPGHPPHIVDPRKAPAGAAKCLKCSGLIVYPYRAKEIRYSSEDPVEQWLEDEMHGRRGNDLTEGRATIIMLLRVEKALNVMKQILAVPGTAAAAKRG